MVMSSTNITSRDAELRSAPTCERLIVWYEMKRLSICFLLFAGMNAFAQSEGVQDFVIDQSKPYVYLKFDHIGPRKPLQKGETDAGLWLRVVNNCRIPIVFRSGGMPDDEPGVVLEDEVVVKPPLIQFAYTPKELKEFEAMEQKRLQRLKHKPAGYSLGDVSGVSTIQPGHDLLFSIPLNHVSEDWYMQVKFALDLKSYSSSLGPFTYLPFYDWDIPEEFRPAKAPNATQEPRKP